MSHSPLPQPENDLDAIPFLEKIEFWVNGKFVSHKIGQKGIMNSEKPGWMPIIEFLREHLNLTGTKLGCSEGGCGSCTIVVTSKDVNNKLSHLSVNACLMPLYAAHGKHIVTIEGLGSVKSGLHPVQEVVAKYHGSQCGFCTPGIVMSLYQTWLESGGKMTSHQVEESWDGNLCRCTGYRPILEGAKKLCGGVCGHSCQSVCSDIEAVVPKVEIADLPSVIEKLPIPKAHAFSNQSLTAGGSEAHLLWYHPTTLEQFLEIMDKYPQARIVNGNTEVGIEIRFRGTLDDVMIYAKDVQGLDKVHVDDGGLHIGANISIGELQKVLLDHLGKVGKERGGTLKALYDNSRYFAGKQVRAVASLGGNIATGSPISDLNTVLMACNVVLTLTSIHGSRKVEMKDFYTGYRKNVMGRGEIITDIYLPYCRPGEYVAAYKQSKRREDDIAIVNSCFRVLVEGGLVEDVWLAYGGMAATTVLAYETMKKVKGRRWDAHVFDDIHKELESDMHYTYSVPGGYPEYRRTLTMSLLERFRLFVEGAMGHELGKAGSGAKEIERGESKGLQYHAHVRDGESQGLKHGYVGQPIQHVAANKQVTGEAIYVDDMPSQGHLFGQVVYSTVAHGKIKSVDASKALELDGVVDWITYKDLPGWKPGLDGKSDPNVRWALWKDEEVFRVDSVTSSGQLIGLIVAETEQLARTAGRLVKVEYEVLPSILTIEEAIEAGSFFEMFKKDLKSGHFAVGTPMEKNLDGIPKPEVAEREMKGRVRISGQEHWYLETQTSIAVPKGEDEMELYVATQNPTETQIAVAHMLGWNANQVVCRVKRIGGGFGGKEQRHLWLTCSLAAAANKLGKPVRCSLSREEDMVMSGTRHPYLGDYKVGFTNDGKLIWAEIDLYANAGYSYDLSGAVLERAVTNCDNAYWIPNMKVTGTLCKTNTPSNTAFRGFGGPQGLMVIERIVCHVAEELGLTVEEVRERNFYREVNGKVPDTYYGQVHDEFDWEKLWNQLKASSGWVERREEVKRWNQVNLLKKRGLAVLPVKFGIAFSLHFLNQAGALVNIYHDGSVLLSHGGTEMGQGLHTKMIQVAAHELSCPIEKVHVMETSTSQVINTSATAASASSDLNGGAVLNACKQLTERLKDLRRENPGLTWEELIGKAYVSQIHLSAAGYYKTPDLKFDWKTLTGRLWNYYTYGAAVTEVELDCLTGEHMVLRSDVLMNLGKSLNPAIDIGQIEGAFVQGQGWSTLEEELYSTKSGQLLTRGPGMYKIPGFKDIPIDFRVGLMADAENPRVIHSSKAVGEPPLFLGSSVYFAIKDAIRAKREELGMYGSFNFDSPATVERIRLAIGDEIVVKSKVEPKEGEKPWGIRI